MTDWGGPIGLDFARRHAERVKRLVIANTWCWPVGDDFHFKSFSFLMSSWMAQYLLRHHNIFVNGVMPRAVGDRSVLTPEIMAHYRGAQPSPSARAASAALPGYIVGASDRLRSIRQDRAAFAEKPALVLWGLKDIAFRRKELERWKSALRDVEIHEFQDCGHFLAEEAPERLWRRFRASGGAPSAVTTPARCGPTQRRHPRRHRQEVHPPQPDPARQRRPSAVAQGHQAGAETGRPASPLHPLALRPRVATCGARLGPTGDRAGQPAWPAVRSVRP